MQQTTSWQTVMSIRTKRTASEDRL